MTCRNILASPLILLAAACGGSPAPAPATTATPATAPAATEATTESAYSPEGPEHLLAAIRGTHRSEENRARDPHRRPVETLAFFGLEPGMTVIELWPGKGWYTEVLAPAVGPGGVVIAATPAPSDEDAYRPRGAREFRAWVEQHRDVLGNVRFAILDPPAAIELGPDGSADMVVTFRNTHNWINDGTERAVYEAAFRALKPGGVFGVVQHRAAVGADAAVTARSGYVPEEHVIRLAESVGFRFDARSELNANPRDTKDYPEGVWSLPPVLRLGDQDRERYVAIGESDRMTLRFVKPPR